MDSALGTAMNVLAEVRSFIRHPSKIVPICDLVEQKLNLLLPTNAHEICTDRLGVSVTRLWPFENSFVSKFKSRNDLIDAVCAGCFIPMWSGALIGPKFRGKLHLDGAYTNNVPKFEPEPGVTQVALCPFAGELEVSPKDEQNWGEMYVFGSKFIFNWNNVIRSTHAMFPMRLHTYKAYLIDGHSNMKDYVLTNNMIKCESCHLVSKSAKCKNDATSCPSGERKLGCIACLRLLERVDSLRPPENLLQMFEDK